jgi:predicted nucleic acid-binding protein
MAEVVLDANVLVGLLDAGDVHHSRARALVDRLRQPPALAPAVEVVRQWFQAGDVTSVQGEATRLGQDVLDVVLATQGALNFNDALVVVLRREGVIDNVASFDQGFDQIEGFGRIE